MKKNYDGKIPDLIKTPESGEKIKLNSQILVKSFGEKMESMKINEAIEDVMQFVRSVNKYLELNAPWKMVKIDKIIAGNILYVAGEALRISAILLSPVMPSRTSLLLEAFNAKKSTLNWGELQSGSIIKDHSPLFPRLN